MHDAAYQYVAARVHDLRALAAEHTGVASLRGITLLEIGSYNVNGSVRSLFPDVEAYIGIDLRPGPSVDVVGPIQTLVHNPVDLVVSCEALEHDPDPLGHLTAASRLLRVGGHLILTAAAPERHPHGCDGGAVGPNEHYAGVVPDWLYRTLKQTGFVDMHVAHVADIGDVYACATKGPI